MITAEEAKLRQAEGIKEINQDIQKDLPNILSDVNQQIMESCKLSNHAWVQLEKEDKRFDYCDNYNKILATVLKNEIEKFGYKISTCSDVMYNYQKTTWSAKFTGYITW